MLLRHTLLYLPAQLLAPLAQFLAAVVWTHWMSPETYGVLTFLVAAQDLVFVVCLSWWSAFCLRYMAGFDEADLEVYRRSEATILTLTIAVGAAASVALLAYLRVLGDLQLVVVTIVFLVSRSVDVHFAERARAQERIFDYTVAQIAGPVVGFLLALVFVREIDPTPAAALAGFAIPQAAAALWLRRRLDVDLSLRRPDSGMVRRALSYGLPMVVGGVLGWISLNGIRFVVQELGGDAALGLLAVGWSLGQRLAGVTAMLVTAAAFPLTVRRFATHSRQEALRQFGAGGTLLVGLVAPAAVGLWQISPLLVDLVIATPFRPVTLAILPAAVITGALRNLRVHYADQTFLLFERTDIGVAINAVEAILVVVAATLGYRSYGIAGAVNGCLVATAIVVVLSFAVARRQFRLPIPVGEWGRIALASGLMVMAVRMIPVMSGREPLQLALDIVVGAVAYGLALLILFPLRAKHMWRRIVTSASQPAFVAKR